MGNRGFYPFSSMPSGAFSFLSSNAGISYLIIPNNISRLLVKIWGAGGAGGNNNAGSVGGAGGYVEGYINILSFMTVLTITVGGGGTFKAAGVGRLARPIGGGGYAGVLGYGGEGGGASSIFLGSSPLAVAAGGGGGGWTSNNEYGGAGGGLTGSNAAAVGGYGLGGTQTAGGAGGYGTGLYLQGADADSPDGGGGGGGGSGYWGGGAGSNGTDGAGGGGSSFCSTAELFTIGGALSVPGNSTDPIRGTAGNGGAYRANGVAGLVYILGT